MSTVCRFQDGFKQMWINNGNTLSKLYAGTAALCSVRIKLSRLAVLPLICQTSGLNDFYCHLQLPC